MKFKALKIPAAWDNQQLEDSSAWHYQLCESEIKELKLAVNHCKNISATKITKQDFALSSLKNTIEQTFQTQLENGIGVLLLRGLSLDEFTEEELEKIFWEIGLYLGKTISQSTAGEHIHQVKDDGYERNHPKARGTNTNLNLPFHIDSCDVSALTCIHKAKTGGTS